MPRRDAAISVRSLLKALLAVALLAGAGVGGYSLRSISAEGRAPTSSATPLPPASPALRSVAPTGIYVDGHRGEPQYFVAFNAGSGGEVGGAVDYLYQDGQTEVAFTFVGVLTGSGEVATLTPVAVPRQKPQDLQLTTALPPSISAVLSPNSISLGGCVAFLPAVATRAGCTFALSSFGS